jgi:predicted dehydrogenase
MIETAIFGLGRWGRSLVQAAACGPLRITHAVEPDAASGEAAAAHRAFAAQHGLTLHAEPEAVLANLAVRAVLLATPHSQHRPQVLAAAASGKAVFCEKPLALTGADARAMLGACRAAGVPLAVGHNRRFWPAMQALRGMLAEGELGQVLHIEAHNSNLNSDAVEAGWRLAPDESPAGGMTGAGLHALDACVALLGPVRRVTARLATQRSTVVARDSVAVLLEFANGCTGLLATVRATPFYWRVHVFGSAGSAEVLGETGLLLRRAEAGPQAIPEARRFAPVDSLRAELDAFAAQLTGTAAPVIPEREILATVLAFEAVVRSVETGAAIDCEDPRG